MIERRVPLILEEAKLSTQRLVTYILLLVFASVTSAVFVGEDQAERSTVLQSVINFTTFAVGFWLGSSKSSTDKDASMARIAENSAPVTAAAVAAASAPIQTEEVKIDANVATVTTESKPKGKKP